MLTVDHIRKDFGSVSAVRDVHFSILDGDTFGLIGPNGAGKTTTMRMILGILAPDAGSIAWNGKRIDGSTRRRFGYLPEERGLYGKMSVRDQIKYFGALHGLTEPTLTQRTDRWIEQLEIAAYARRPCSELSKGNQQKVQVACAAVHEPELLILDEPFSGLDPVNADMLHRMFLDLNAKGTTLVLSSHQLWQLESLCGSFCVIAQGENRVSGTLAALRVAWPTRMLRVAPPSAVVREALLRVPGARERASQNGTFDVDVPADTAFAGVLKSLVEVESIVKFETVEPSLQDIYLKAIGADAK